MTKKDIIYLSISIISIGLIILWIISGYQGKNIHSLFTEAPKEQIQENEYDIDSTIKDSNMINIEQEVDSSEIRQQTSSQDTNTNTIPNITTNEESQESKEDEVRHTYDGNETFRDGTIRIKTLLEEKGYNYNNVKKEYIKLFINKSENSIDWNKACAIYLNKRNPDKGDYLYFIK